MALTNYTNTGKTNVHIDGKTILPGESRAVDETQVPGFGVADDNADGQDFKEADTLLADILLGTAKEIAAALSGLNDEQLDQLELLEGDADKPRKGVLDSINHEQLVRAQAGL